MTVDLFCFASVVDPLPVHDLRLSFSFLRNSITIYLDTSVLVLSCPKMKDRKKKKCGNRGRKQGRLGQGEQGFHGRQTPICTSVVTGLEQPRPVSQKWGRSPPCQPLDQQRRKA